MTDPIVIKPSVSSFCNRTCEFCGIYTTDLSFFVKNKCGYMSLDIAEIMAINIGKWIKKGLRFELGGFGEPTLNKNLPEIIKIIRENNLKSQILVYTNSHIINLNLLEELFENGLNILFMDIYNENILSKVKFFKENLTNINFINYEKSEFNPYRKNSINKKIICYQDYSNTNSGIYNKKVKKLHNYAGNIHKKSYNKYNIRKVEKPYNKMCTRPFRELVITSDGLVPICCLDWKRELVFGDITETNVKNIWQSTPFEYFRKKLYDKNRNFIPCSRCNNISYRVGLINQNIKYINDDPKLHMSKIKMNKEKFDKYELKWKNRKIEFNKTDLNYYLKGKK